MTVSLSLTLFGVVVATPAAVFCSLQVIRHFGPAAFDSRTSDEPQAWLVRGILVSFAGKTLDNLFWLGACTSYLAGHPEPWFALGPVVNIVFRQGATVMASAHHMRAYRQTTDVRVSPIPMAVAAAVACGTMAILGWRTGV